MNPEIHKEKINDLSGAIIAGGKSQRFGSPKALARLDHNSLLDIAVAALESLTSEILIITSKERIFLRYDIPVVTDIVPECGPLGGIYTALVCSRTRWIATIPCDMPLLNAEVYRWLYTCKAQDRPIVARSEFGAEPLVAIWPKSVAPVIESLLKQKKRDVKNCLYQTGAVQVDVARLMPGYQPDWFRNVNFKKDLEGIKCQYFGEPDLKK